MSEPSTELPPDQSHVTPDAQQHLMPVPAEMFDHLRGLEGDAFDSAYTSTRKAIGAIGLYQPLTIDTIEAAHAEEVDAPNGFIAPTTSLTAP